MRKELTNYPGYSADESGVIYGLRGKPLKGVIHTEGYLVYNLRRGSKQHMEYGQRLIAITFVPNPHNKPTVNHKDRIKVNNSANNLEWATQAEQIAHFYNTGGHNKGSI